jgi:hypothetical protein
VSADKLGIRDSSVVIFFVIINSCIMVLGGVVDDIPTIGEII